MREHFTQEIVSINQELLRMTVLVEENIQKARRALQTQDTPLAKEVISADKRVNAYELSITDRCVVFIAREQPVASDLRHIVACLKAVSDIERIGDYAVQAAKRVKELAEDKPLKALETILTMLSLGCEMLRDAVSSLIHADAPLARQTATRDEEMDQLYKGVYRELLDLMLKEREQIKLATKLLFLCRFWERVGDHAVNICNWALYSAQGQHEDL